ncbi:MAG TPA: ABC transporter permease [candidate division Zixibacteria bacterium]|nr:ABC transporter permease [candidate division Zixibacteria bacterium]
MKQESLSISGKTESEAEDLAPARGGRGREAARDVALRVGSIFAMLLSWWVLSLFFPPTLVPKPWATLEEVGAIIASGTFFSEMGSTLRRVFVGFAIAMAGSVPLGILMGTSRSLESFFEPPVILGLTMPGLIWAVLMIMFFGLTETSAYAAVAVTILPMLTISLWQGTKAIDKDLIDMSKAFHASAWSKVADVILPQLVAHILAAVRYGLGLAWKVVVVVEMFGFSNGVGYQVVRGFNVFSMKTVLAWAITFLIVMIVIEFGIIGWLERLVTRWRPRVEAWRR